MKAWGRLLAAAGAALIVLASAAGTSAAPRAHRRHVQVFPPSNQATLYLGEQGGYGFAILFKEPDEAVLQVIKFDNEVNSFVLTNYGAHFRGSLPYGRVRADFGPIGTVSVRFHPDGKARSGKVKGNCTGRPGRREIAVSGSEADLDISGRPQLAEWVTVHPPAPSTGTATFARTHESTFTWTGDLAVTFPGLDPIRLTGPRFGVKIFALKGCATSLASSRSTGS